MDEHHQPQVGAGLTGDGTPPGALARLAPLAALPVPVWLLLLAALFFVPFGDPADVAITLGAAAVITVTERHSPTRSVGPPRPTPLPARWRLVLVALVAATASLAGSLRLYSRPAAAVTVAAGIAVFVASERRAHAPRALPTSGEGSGRPWAVVALVLCAWELIAFSYQPSKNVNAPDHPTLSVLVEEAQRHGLGRAAVVGAWLALGIWLVRR
ncbi:MAG: hypothetical protein H6513_15610 [Acidimicrobiaceae bacterium]|nr:hypothetical protein [Actinomycetota bacterium]MCB9382112.1 hypothetical protein [Acidimicrobiaceae bacterium]